MGRLFWKFFLSIFLAQLVAVFGISGAIWLKDRNQAWRLEVIERSPPASTTLEAASSTLQYGGTEALRNLLRNMTRHQVYAFDSDNQEILGRHLNPNIVEQARALADHNEDRYAVRKTTSANGAAYLLLVPAQADRPRPGSMRANNAGPGRPAEERPHPPSRGPRFPFMPMLFAMIASLVSAGLLAWHFSKPIRSLRGAFDAASRGNLDARVATTMGKRNDELADLGREFDRMAAQLEASMQAQRRLLHDVSHEMRSPLARMQAAIGLARQAPEKTANSLDRIERESERMNMLVGELLTLSRLEAGAAGKLDQQVNIRDLVADIVDDARFEAETQGKLVHFRDEGGGVVTGNAELLHRAIENVIRNAVKHTAEATQVDIHLKTAVNGMIELSITDHGPGVPDDELDSIFHPFFRGSRTSGNTYGHGLGLAIAKRTMDAHRGTIRASNLSGGGLRVDISLPSGARH